jgi:hypothetical protein
MIIAGIFLSPLAAMVEGALRPAGYITVLNGIDEDGKSNVRLRREGLDIDVQIWTPLFAGDVLEVSGAATVTIETVRDKRLTLDASRSPHRIEGALPSGGTLVEMANLIGDLFKTKPPRDVANLIGRSDPSPRLRIGEGVIQRVSAGTILWLSWQGGTPPYAVEIHGQTEKRKHDIGRLAAATSDTTAVTLRIPPSASGHLTLVIRGANDVEARIRLETVAPPQFPAWIEAGAPTPEYTKVAQALFLLQQPDRGFDLMAAAHAAEVKDYPAAAALLRLLAEGRRPK